MKKLLCNTLIIIIMLGVFCNGYFSFSGLSFLDRFSCYAESSSVTDDDVVESFKAYCRSRNLIVDSSILGAASSWTGSAIRKAMDTIGVDMDTIQANISKETGGNLGVRWLLTATGMNIYNRLFAELLQRESLSVGDEDVDKIVYSGKTFTDSNGNKCLVYITKTISATDRSGVLQYGTLLFNGAYFASLYDGGTNSFTYNNHSYSITKNTQYADYPTYSLGNRYVYGFVNAGANYHYKLTDSGACIMFANNSQKYYFANTFTYVNTSNNRENFQCVSYNEIIFGNDDTADNTDVTVTTPPDKKILPDPPENPTTIYPSGDTDDDPDNPDDGGDDDPDDPLDPYDPTKPFPDTPDNPTTDPGVHGSPGSDGTITLPDFNFDIPDINWSLDGLQNKFPFSLPFDLYNACKLLNAEPETPEIDCTVDLVVYQWPVQLDLHWLDPAARVIRIFELLAFVVGLILITRHLIGG